MNQQNTIFVETVNKRVSMLLIMVLIPLNRNIVKTETKKLLGYRDLEI